MKKIAVVVFASLALSGLASASIIPHLDGSPVLSGGAYTWNYYAQVSGDEQLNPSATAGQCGSFGGAVAGSQSAPCPSGTYFTLYDVNGFTNPAAVMQPAGWTSSLQLTGVTPTLINAASFDSAGVVNITYYYTGPTVPTVMTSTDLIVRGFSFQSTIGTSITGQSSFNATKFGFTGLDQGTNPVTLPGGSGVPEPASMLLIGGGLVGLALLRRKLAS